MTFQWLRLATPALAGLLALAQASPVAAQAARKTPDKPRERPKLKELVVSPAPEPIPAFRYSLLPSSARLNPGDAAPIYLRLRYRLRDEHWQKIQKQLRNWLDGPIQELPFQEAGTVVAWKDAFELLSIGARRTTCDWSYPVDEQSQSILAMPLEDVEAMRVWGRLLAVKARVEIAEGRFEDGARTLETGFAFGRHVGEGPFAINGLLGAAIEWELLERVEEWLASPGSPNLYWALTALPRPLVSLRKGDELERLIAEKMIPELGDVDAPRSSAAWSDFLGSMYRRMRTTAERFLVGNPSGRPDAVLAEKLNASLAADLASYKRDNLAAFRKSLVGSGRYAEAQVQAMSDDEAAARGVALGYRTVWDENFKLIYLSDLESRQIRAEREAAVEAAKNGPFALFALLQADLHSRYVYVTRLDRGIALFRTVEAIRMYAASHEGKLPDSLDAIHEAPVPTDPVTGEPFTLDPDGEVATLTSPAAPPMPLADYKITIRKDAPNAAAPH